MKTIFLICACCFFIYSHAQFASPDIEWQKCLGGSSYDRAFSIMPTKDGGYIMGGDTHSDDGDVIGGYAFTDIWVVKQDSAGAIQWQKSLGGNWDDYWGSIRQTKEGGYILAGISYSNDGDVSGHHGTSDYLDIWVAKLDDTGAIEWQRSLGGTKDEDVYDIEQTADGGYIIGGGSFSNNGNVSGHHGSSQYEDCWVIKLSRTGIVEWQRSLGGTNTDVCYSVQQTRDGGYIIAGVSSSNDGDVSGNNGSADFWIVKLDSMGNTKWQNCLGGTSGESARSIQQIKDGGYIVAGSASSNNGDVSGNHGASDYWIVKLDSTGTIDWQKCLGGTNDDIAKSIQQTTDGGYITGGESYSSDGDVSGHHGSSQYEDYWIVKLDRAGAIQWQKCLGGTSYEGFGEIRQAKDLGYIAAGLTYSNDGDVSGLHGISANSDCWVIKLETDVVLPLSILHFSAQPLQNKTVLVAWSTPKEAGSKYFTVQKSNDAINFTDAGMVRANGALQNISSYSFTDYAPFTGVSYYRLQQTNIDGTVAYSDIVSVKIVPGAAGLLVFPNPSRNGVFTADLRSVKNNILVTVTDNSGRKIYANKLSSAQYIVLRISNQPKGIYYLQISFTGGEEQAKIVIK